MPTSKAGCLALILVILGTLCLGGAVVTPIASQEFNVTSIGDRHDFIFRTCVGEKPSIFEQVHCGATVCQCEAVKSLWIVERVAWAAAAFMYLGAVLISLFRVCGCSCSPKIATWQIAVGIGASIVGLAATLTIVLRVNCEGKPSLKARGDKIGQCVYLFAGAVVAGVLALIAHCCESRDDDDDEGAKKYLFHADHREREYN